MTDVPRTVSVLMTASCINQNIASPRLRSSADQCRKDVSLGENPLVGSTGVIGRGIVIPPNLSIRIAQYLAAVRIGLDRAQYVVVGIFEGFSFHKDSFAVTMRCTFRRHAVI